MDIFLIAPPSGLHYAQAEVQSVVNSLRPELLWGAEATADRLMVALQSKQYDLIWYVGHSNSDGIELEDGLLSRETLVQFMRWQDAAGLFLNSCSSLGVAMDIHDELNLPVICTVSDVADQEAYHTGAIFARHLARNKSLREAYELARPGRNRQFLYLNGQVRGTDRIDELHIQMRLLLSEVQTLNGRVDEVEQALDSMHTDLRNNYQVRPRRENALRVIVGITMLILCQWLFYFDVRQNLGIDFIVAGIIASLSLPTAIYFVLNGLGYSMRTFSPEERL